MLLQAQAMVNQLEEKLAGSDARLTEADNKFMEVCAHFLLCCDGIHYAVFCLPQVTFAFFFRAVPSFRVVVLWNTISGTDRLTGAGASCYVISLLNVKRRGGLAG